MGESRTQEPGIKQLGFGAPLNSPWLARFLSIALIFVTIALPKGANAEGSKQLTPNMAGTATTPYNSATYGNTSNTFVGFLQTDDNEGQKNSRSFMKPYYTGLRDGVTWSADEQLQVRVKAGETLHFGFHRIPTNSGQTFRDMVIVLRYGPAPGTVVFRDTLIADVNSVNRASFLAGQAGAINTHNEANFGPKINNLPSSGYDPLSYLNSTGGDQNFWVETYQVGETGNSVGGYGYSATLPAMSPQARKTWFDIWDFTVKTPLGATRNGRLSSKSWSFTAGGGVLSSTFNIFPLVPDPNKPGFFYVKRWNLSGLNPYGAIFRCNGQGTTAGTTDMTRRQSQLTDLGYPEFPIYINNPDPIEYPSGNALTFRANAITICDNQGNIGAAIINFFVSEVGSGYVLLDLDNVPGFQSNSTKDLLIEQIFTTPGFHSVLWDGKDKSGATVPNGTAVKTYLRSTSAAIHFPIWDAEYYLTGFRVFNVRPGATNAGNLVYWDDNLLPAADFPIRQELYGIPSTNGVHKWGANSAAGNTRLVNTWTYGQMASDSVVLDFTFDCDKDNDGIDDINDIDDDNDGISDWMEHSGVDPLVTSVTGFPRFLDVTYVHPIRGGFRDGNNDGINDLFDIDQDGIIDSYDIDSDGDGLADALEANAYSAPANYDPNTGRITGAVGLNGMPDAIETAPESGITLLALTDTDGDGRINSHDADSDNDGLTDLREAATTAAFLAPLNLDADDDGLDDRFDIACAPCATNGTAIVLSNKDGADAIDMLDQDSDNDGSSDFVEGFDDTDDGFALDDLYDRRQAYRIATGNSTHYPTTDANGNDNFDFLDDADNDGLRNLFEGGTSWFRDANHNGLVDLFDDMPGMRGVASYLPKFDPAFPDYNFRNVAFVGSYAGISDIAVTISAPTVSLFSGASFTFTVTAENLGPNNTGGVDIAVPLPTGFTFVSSTAGASYNSTTGSWAASTFAVGATKSITITAFPNNFGTFPLSGTLSSMASTDPNPSNDTAVTTVTVIPSLDIAVTDEVSVGPNTIGNAVLYEVTVTNNGPQNATGLDVTKLLPLGVNYISHTSTPSTTYNPTTGVWSIGTLNVGAQRTLLINAMPTLAGNFPGQASVSALNEGDVNPANDIARDTLVVKGELDVAITNTRLYDAHATVGVQSTFYIVAKNNDPTLTATNMVINYSLPLGLTLNNALPSEGTYAAGQWTLPSLSPGESDTLRILATPTFDGPITTVAFLGGIIEADTVGANNTAWLTIYVGAIDVGITSMITPGPYSINDTLTITYTATNNSNKNVLTPTNFKLNNLGNFTFISAVPSTGSSYSNTNWSSTAAWLPGTQRTLVLKVRPNQLTPQTITAALNSTNNNQTDTFPSNNSTSDTILVLSYADMQVTQRLSNPAVPVINGVTSEFRIVARNLGPNPLSGGSVTVPIPAGMTYVSTAQVNGTYSATTGLWTLSPTIPVGDSAILRLNLRPTVGSTITMIASRNGAYQQDTVPTNNVDTLLINPGASIDIRVVKTAPSGNRNLGQTYTYRIEAINLSTTNATSLVLRDTLVSNLTFVSYTTNNASVYNVANGQWAVGNLNAGDTARLFLNVFANTTASVANTASYLSSTETDIVSTNNVSTVTTNVNNNSDIAYTISVSAGPYAIGGQNTYTLTATNVNGTSATGMIGQLSFSSNVSYNSVGTPSQGTFNATNRQWDIGTLAPGASASMTFVGVLTNTSLATVTFARSNSSTMADFNTVNNSAAVTISTASADLAMGISRSGLGVTSRPDTLTLTAQNVGTVSTSGAIAQLTLPAGVTITGASTTAFNTATRRWTIPNLVASASAAPIRVYVAPTLAMPSTYTLTRVALSQFDNQAANDTARTNITYAQGVDMELRSTLTGSPFQVGQSATWTLRALSNLNTTTNGPITYNVTGLSNFTVTSVNAQQGSSFDPMTNIWTLNGNVAPGGSNSQYLTFNMTPNALGSYTIGADLAGIGAGQIDLVSSNNTRSHAVDVFGETDLAVTNVVTATSPIYAGDTLIYTIKVKNNGPLIATGVVIKDSLATGMSFTSNVPSQGTLNTATGLWSVGTLAVGDSATLVVRSIPSTPGNLTTRARLTATAVTDSFGPNNSQDVTVAVVGVSDLAVSLLRTGPATSSLGDTLRISVTNNGPHTSTGGAITLSIPTGYTITGTSGGSGSFNSTTRVWTLPSIANGASPTPLRVFVTPNAGGPATYEVIRTAQTTKDPVATNDTARTSISNNQHIDIAVTGAVNPGPYFVGQSTVVTFTATKLGPGQANATTTYQIAGLNNFNVISSNPSNGGSFNSMTNVWTSPSSIPANGGTRTISFTVQPLDTLNRTLTAVLLSTAADQTDLAPGNNLGSVSIKAGSDVDMALSVNAPSTAALGDTVEVVYTMSNVGSITSSNLSAQLQLPANFTFLTSQSTAPGNYNAGSGIWSLVNPMVPNTSRTLTIRGIAQQPTAYNFGGYVATMTGFDRDRANDTTADVMDVTEADLALAIVATPAFEDTIVRLNTSVVTIVTTNIGPDDINHYSVNVTIPAGLGYQSYVGPGTFTNVSGTTYRWTPIGYSNGVALANAESDTLRLTLSGVDLGDFQVRAAIASQRPRRTNTTNDSAATTIRVEPRIDGNVTLEFVNGTYNAGEIMEFRINTRSLEIDSLTNSVIILPLPATMTFNQFGAFATNVTYNQATHTITWEAGDLGLMDAPAIKFFVTPINPVPITMTATMLTTNGNKELRLDNNTSALSLMPGALPVTLVGFTARAENGKVVLGWQTASESNTSHFVVERASGETTNSASATFASFGEGATVAAAGNSNSLLAYGTIDAKPLQGLAYYRLRSIDIDGSSTLSQVVAVRINAEGAAVQRAPIVAWPIPFRNSCSVNVPEAGLLTVADGQGRPVASYQVKAGQTLDLGATLAQGIYTLILNGQQLRVMKAE